MFEEFEDMDIHVELPLDMPDIYNNLIEDENTLVNDDFILTSDERVSFLEENGLNVNVGQDIQEANTFETIDIDNIDDVSFKASQQEINSHISHAKSEMAHAESNMRHNESIIKSKTRMGEPHSFEDSQYNHAKRVYEEAKAEYDRWKREKPDDRK